MYNRITAISFLMLFLNSVCSSQETDKPFLSSFIYFIYPYPPLYSNKFNYGIGGEIDEHFTPFKFSTGLFFYTNKYEFHYDKTSPYEKNDFSLNYFNFSFNVKIKLSNKNKTDNLFLLNTGIIINIPRNYRSVFYYKKNIPPEENIPIKYGNGISLRLGFQYNKSLSNRLKVYANLFCDYKFQKDHIDFYISNPHPGPDSYYEGYILFWGVSCGLEFLFVKNKI